MTTDSSTAASVDSVGQSSVRRAARAFVTAALVAAIPIDLLLNRADGVGVNAPLIAASPKMEQPAHAKSTGAVRAYPNPVSRNVTIDLPEGFRTATLFDLQGRVIRQWIIKPGETRFVKDLGFLKDGFYLIKLEGNGKTEMVRIIKQ